MRMAFKLNTDFNHERAGAVRVLSPSAASIECRQSPALNSWKSRGLENENSVGRRCVRHVET